MFTCTNIKTLKNSLKIKFNHVLQYITAKILLGAILYEKHFFKNYWKKLGELAHSCSPSYPRG